jgi:hypothetical protein
VLGCLERSPAMVAFGIGNFAYMDAIQSRFCDAVTLALSAVN